MKRTILAATVAFTLGMWVNSVALSEGVATPVIKLGVVDVQKVVENSKQVASIKKAEEAKKAQMVKWLSTVKADIQKQATEEGKVKLAKKYDAELAKKQEANRNDYVKKIEAVDKAVSKAINDTAKAQGYTIVFQKGAILYGGEDLTPAIQKIVK